ncbi:hypothetical protein OEA41_002231 [Lepraria neglecta]|uniref:DUF7730 domain-containing protein n=1 Tax=Lepraria neglecta TaxID=209136 RepID=A0AAD9ZB89_9LECA|nr:hypothetical protein OEA41_002231 [Lepraria neglecta]
MPRTHHQNLSNVTIDTSLNAHCKLLNKLPLEIRQQIYTEVLKDDAYGHRSRIVTEKGRLTSVLGCECNQNRLVQRLALLKTCRQVYTEAIDLFYSSWVFHIHDLDTLISLTRTVVPHRLAKIKILQLCFGNCWPSSIKGDLISGLTNEEISSTVVNKLTGLKELHLNIYQHTHVELPYGTAESERKTLEPLLILRGLEDFDLRYVHGHQHHDDNCIDTSPEAVAFREYVKGVVCTPKG